MAPGKVTRTHGPIADRDMLGMAMGFVLANPMMLDHPKPGGQVSFVTSNQDGAITITNIEMAK